MSGVKSQVDSHLFLLFTFTMKKPQLNIANPAVQQYAASEFFTQMQDTFNLYPEHIAQKIRKIARDKFNLPPLQVAPSIQRLTALFFSGCMEEVIEILKGGLVISDKPKTDLHVFFNLDAGILASGILNRCSKNDMSPSDILNMGFWIQNTAPAVFDWAFTEALEIISRDKKV